jgi:hypothetical protein
VTSGRVRGSRPALEPTDSPTQYVPEPFPLTGRGGGGVKRLALAPETDHLLPPVLEARNERRYPSFATCEFRECTRQTSFLPLPLPAAYQSV